MVDDVVITGIDGLPEWASEKTQAAILKELQAMHKLTTTQSKQVQQSLSKMGRSGAVSEADFMKARKAFTSGLKDAADSAVHAAAGFDKLPGPLRKFGAELKKSSGMFKGAMVGIGLLGTAIGATIKTVQESVTVLRSLSDSGVIFNKSIVSIQETLADTGLTLEKFSEIAGKYARVIGTNGLQGLTQFVTRTRELTKGFSKFGLTTADATEYAAEYLDQQRLAGVFGQAINRRQAAALEDNIARLTAYSKVLNVSRQAMQDATKQMLTRDDLQAMFFTMVPAEREKAQKAFTTISQGLASLGPPGQKVLEMFTDMAASPIEENSEAFKQMATVAPEFAQELVKMSRNMKEGVAVSQSEIISMAERASANTKLIDALRLAGGEVKSNAELLAGLGMAAQEARVSQAQLAKKADEAGMSMDDYLKSVDKNVAAATNLDDSLQRLQATAEYTMIKTFAQLVGGEATDAVNAMAKGVNELTDKLRAFTDGDLTDFMSMLHNLLVEGKGLTGLATALGALTVAAGATGAALGGLGSMAARGLGSLIGSLGSRAGLAALGSAGAVAGAGAGGYWLGSKIYDATADTRTMEYVGDTLGSAVDHIMSFFGSSEAGERINTNRQAATFNAAPSASSVTPPPPPTTPAPAAAGGQSALAPPVVDTSRMEQLLEINVDEIRKLRRAQPTNDVMQ